MEEKIIPLKESFYAKVGDLHLFDCMEFNLLKVVLEGLKTDYLSNLKMPFHHLRGYGNLYRWAKNIQLKKKDKRYAEKVSYLEKNIFGKHYDYLLLDVGRIAKGEQDKIVSVYFENIQTYFKENNLNHLFVVDKSLSDDIAYDLSVEEYHLLFSYIPLDTEEKELLYHLNLSLKKIKKKRVFSEREMANIGISYILFFLQFRFWHQFFLKASFSKVIFIRNYYREGFQLACKRKGIITEELQHGLISAEHLFYMYPPDIKEIVNSALFPDKIYTFGKFWTESLLSAYEFRKEQIVELGYYMYANKHLEEAQRKEIENFGNQKKRILVTTQYTAHEPYIKYICWLSKDIQNRNLNAVIWVKLHPSENNNVYKEIASLENVSILNVNLDALLSYADLMVSICSTTLYDASRYNLRAFSLNEPKFAHYVESIVASGVAKKLEYGENPLDKDDNALPLDSTYFYKLIDYSLLLSK